MQGNNSKKLGFGKGISILRVKAGLIFTLDYEIHGNGSGEFKNWAYFPTAHMLDLFDSFGAKLTIMAEMGHYWAMKRYEAHFKEDIALFEAQLKDAIKRGHDVQFHFHPQWIDAIYDNGNWELDFSRKTIQRLCLDYDEALFYLIKGKTELQNLLTPINPDYKCVCFRAGFLQMQPSEHILKALADAGFLSDSSVSKGMVFDNSLISINYSDANSDYIPWKISDSDICRNDETGKIIEFPILSGRIGLSDKVWKKINTIRRGKRLGTIISGLMASYGKGMMPVDNSPTTYDRLKRVAKSSWYYTDFCNGYHDDLTRHLRKLLSDSKKNSVAGFIPVVMIGHSKDFFFANNLAMLLESCKNSDRLEFITYSDAVVKYMKDTI